MEKNIIRKNIENIEIKNIVKKSFYKKSIIKNLLLYFIFSTLFINLIILTGCSNNDSFINSSYNNQIIIALSSDITSLDPHEHNDTFSANATRHIYNNLVKFDEENNLIGDLAEAWENINDNSMEFKLKEDVYFHNGESLTSEDVKFSLERQLESIKVSHAIGTIQSIEIIDDLNFIINYSSNSAILLAGLAHNGSCILDKTTVEMLEAKGQTLNENPIGTGAYIFESYIPNTELVLVKNENYFDADEIALNNGIMFKIITDDIARTRALENNDIDLIVNVNSADAQKIRDTEDISLVEYETTTLEYLVMNTSKEPFDNLLVRQAINHAVNKEAILEIAIHGEGILTDCYVAKGDLTYTENIKTYEYNLEKALSLLEEAGYPNGFDCTIYVSSDSRAKIASVIQADLAILGINMIIQQMDTSSFFEVTSNGEHDMALSGWIADTEPDNNFRPLLHSDSIGNGGNRSFYSNAVIDNLIDEGVTISNFESRLEVYKNIHQILSEDAPWVPLYTSNGIIAQNTKLKGLILYPTSRHIYTNLHY